MAYISKKYMELECDYCHRKGNWNDGRDWHQTGKNSEGKIATFCSKKHRDKYFEASEGKA